MQTEVTDSAYWLAQSAFLETTSPGTAPPTTGWALPPVADKKMSYSQIAWKHFEVCSLLQTILAYVNLTSN